MNRRPLGAWRDRAERYLLVTVAAFAVTVAGVRWYLDLAGYPTIGGGELHVAHVLWGGLALVLAALLPMLWVGRRSLLLSALLAGIGVGLFIDEVGKFLTTSNDYFFAPAAPIIYGGILLLVLVWLIVRRRSGNSYDATQAVVEALRDGVDGRLTEPERRRIIGELRAAQAEAPSSADAVSDQLVSALASPAMDDRLASPGWIASGQARSLLERIVPTRLERWLILGGLLWTALQALVATAVLLAQDRFVLGGLESVTDATSPIEVPSEPFWSLLLLGIAIVVGVASLAAIILALRGRERQAVRFALGATLVGLVAGDLVAFYAFQIAALASTVLDLALLGLIIDYRVRIEERADSS